MNIYKVMNGYVVAVQNEANSYRRPDEYIFLTWDEVINFVRDFKFEEKAAETA